MDGVEVLFHTKRSAIVLVVQTSLDVCCYPGCHLHATRRVVSKYTWVYCAAHWHAFLKDHPCIVNPLPCICKLGRHLLRALARYQHGQGVLCFAIGSALDPYFVIGPCNSLAYSPKGRVEFATMANMKVPLTIVHDVVLFHKQVCSLARHVILFFVKHATYFPRDLRKMIGRITWGMRIAWSQKIQPPVFKPICRDGPTPFSQ